MGPIDYNVSMYAFCSKSRRITRDVNASISSDGFYAGK